MTFPLKYDPWGVQNLKAGLNKGWFLSMVVWFCRVTRQKVYHEFITETTSLCWNQLHLLLATMFYFYFVRKNVQANKHHFDIKTGWKLDRVVVLHLG